MKLVSLFRAILYKENEPFFQDLAMKQDAMGAILEPEPLPFSFDTLGWKILGVLILIWLCIILVRRIKQYQKNTYRREAIKRIVLLETDSKKSCAKINHLNITLKQVAITTFGREPIAVLFGDDWYSFLDSKVKGSSFVEYSNTFTSAMYDDREVEMSELKKIFELTKKWINAHS